ncbi:MAG TPA: hypothetical protein VHD85_13975 [Terracidiphilus sp.]|nr:hypothetical protein [Terracidiphilus sp.]
MAVLARWVAACSVLVLWRFAGGVHAQQPDAATVIRGVDAAVQSRYERVLSFTDVEHYAVYRGGDMTHPAAEMTVKDTYRKDVGKTYDVLSQSGSGTIIRFGLNPLLDNEKTINLPANLPSSWFISANYEMKPKLGQTVQMNGRECFAIDITAKRKAPNAINGSMWVDTKDYSLVQIDGTATKSPSIFSGPAHMMRQYKQIDGFSMATHARAESDSFLFGRTVVTIDYSDYHLQLKPEK